MYQRVEVGVDLVGPLELRTWATPRARHAEIARAIELYECKFVTSVIDIVHDRVIFVRGKGLIGSTEYSSGYFAVSTQPVCLRSKRARARTASISSGEHTMRNMVAIMLISQEHYEITSSRAVTQISCYTVGLIASSASRYLFGFLSGAC